MKNITLIGMSGAGKSTIGVLLAKALGYEFVDTDLMIQKKEGKLLQEIIDEKGIEYFLTVEGQVIESIKAEKSIISTGGSVIYKSNAMKHLSEISEVIYLQVSFKEIERRLENITTRGIVMEKPMTLKDVYEERISLYEKYADFKLNCDEMGIEEIISFLTQKYK